MFFSVSLSRSWPKVISWTKRQEEIWLMKMLRQGWRFQRWIILKVFSRSHKNPQTTRIYINPMQKNVSLLKTCEFAIFHGHFLLENSLIEGNQHSFRLWAPSYVKFCRPKVVTINRNVLPWKPIKPKTHLPISCFLRLLLVGADFTTVFAASSCFVFFLTA